MNELGGIIMETRENVFTKMVSAVSDFQFYKRMVGTKMSSAILYIFVFSLIVLSLQAVVINMRVAEGLEMSFEYLNEELPYFKIKAGELFYEGATPDIFYQDEYTFIVVDPDGVYDFYELEKEYDSVMYVGKNSLFVKQPNQIQTIHYDDFPETVTKNDIMLLKQIFESMFTVLLVIYAVFGFLGKMFSALFLSILVSIFLKIMKVNILFGDRYKLSLYALTVPILIKFVFFLLNFTMPYFWVLYYGIALVYIYLGLRDYQTPTWDDDQYFNEVDRF